VVVRGHAAVPAEPDQLEVTLTVSAVTATPDEALVEAGRLNAELGRVLDELAVRACDRSQSGLAVREEFERIEGRWARRGYRAANVAVRMTDPSHVGRLLREAVGRVGAQVDGPRWRCRPDHPARAEACRQAAADARRRAAAYAAALGLRLGPVLRVAEQAGDGGAPGPGPALTPTDMRIRAGHLDVEAAVEVTFSLEPGEA